MTEDETRTDNAASAEFPAPPEPLPYLPTTLSPGALARIGLPDDDADLRAEVQAQLAKAGPGHGRAMLRFSLTDDILGASIAAAQRTESGWEFTESAGVTYSRRDEKLTARVTLEVSY